MAEQDGFALIPAPPLTPPRLGLLASAIRPNQEGDTRWVGGLKFRPFAQMGDQSLDGGAWWDTCMADPAWATVDPDAVEPDGIKGVGPPEVSTVFYLPWQMIEAKECNASGVALAEYEALSRQRLAANESRRLEREFWLGEIAQAGNLPNDYLANPATVDILVPGERALAYALGALQQYLADMVTGRGMIHCSVFLYSLWLSAGMVHRDGNVILDGMDNVVVPGTGYDASGPEGETDAIPGELEWAYATNMVHVMESPVIVPGDPAAFVGQSTNQVTLRAERFVAAFTDQQAHGAILVDMCNPCCTPAAS